jgi:hypothetical protein
LAHLLIWVKRLVLRARLRRSLHALFEAIARYDFAVYQLDKEVGDEVARHIKRTRRRAIKFATALQNLPHPQPKGRP